MLAEVLRVALRCACWGAAKSLLKETGPAALLPDQAEQIVISVARGFFYGADSLDAVEVIKVMLQPSKRGFVDGCGEIDMQDPFLNSLSRKKNL
jgi:hypothetical protein